MDRLVGAGCLCAKLVAGEVEHFETLGMILLIEFLQLFILWSEATFGGGVDDEQHFVGILFQ